MAWVDYKKAYDMVPHWRIKECLDLFRVAENINTLIVLIVNSMDKWRVILFAGNSDLGEVDIKRGVFQVDSFISFSFCFSIDLIKFDFKKDQGRQAKKRLVILFSDDSKLYGANEKELDSLDQTIRIFGKDIGIEFGIEERNFSNRERKDCEISYYGVATW